MNHTNALRGPPQWPELNPPRRGLRSLALPRATLTIATGLAAALPVLVSTIRGLAEGWVPFGDQAVIATRAYDVFSAHSPLVGQYSASARLTGHPTFGLGPLLYWLLALPARFGPPSGVAVTMGLVNAAAVFGVVVLARRRGGTALMFASAIALVVMSRSLTPEVFHDVWNPSAPLLPFTLLIFLGWSLACGEYRLLPLTVLVASFVVQCHFAYVPATVGIVAVGVAGLIATRRSRPRRAARRWVWAAAGVGALCWSAPVADEIVHRPGNLTLVARAALAHEPTAGWALGWHALARAVGVPPWWLQSPADPFHQFADVQSRPSAVAGVSAALLLCALVLVALLGLRRRRADLAAGAAIALVLCASLALVTAHTPTQPVLMATLGYTLWWSSPAGMFVWLFLGFSAVTLAPSRLRLRAAPRPALAAPLLAGVALLAGVLVAAGQKPDLHQSLYRPVSAITAHLDGALGGARSVRLAGSGGMTSVLRAGVRFELRRRGILGLAPGGRWRWGPAYQLGHRPYQYSVYLIDGARPTAGEGRLIGLLNYWDGTQAHTLAVSVAPH